jgi:hypothetical protein
MTKRMEGAGRLLEKMSVVVGKREWTEKKYEGFSMFSVVP